MWKKISRKICANFTTLVTLGSSWTMAKRLVWTDLAVVRAVNPVWIISSGFTISGSGFRVLADSNSDDDDESTFLLPDIKWSWMVSRKIRTFSKFLTRKQWCVWTNCFWRLVRGFWGVYKDGIRMTSLFGLWLLELPAFTLLLAFVVSCFFLLWSVNPLILWVFPPEKIYNSIFCWEYRIIARRSRAIIKLLARRANNFF